MGLHRRCRDRRRLRVLHGAPPLPPEQLATELEHYNPVPAGSSNVMVRRTVLDTVGCFDPKLLSRGGLGPLGETGHHGRPAWVPRPFVGCRVHGNTITRNRHRMLKEVDIVAARHELPVDRARHFRWAAWNSMLEGRRVEAIGHYARAGTGRGRRLGRAIDNCSCRSRNCAPSRPRGPRRWAGRKRRCGSTPCVDPPTADRHGVTPQSCASLLCA